MSIHNNDQRPGLCNPHDPQNYNSFKDSPYYSKRGLAPESSDIVKSGKGNISPFPLVEKIIFKTVFVIFLILCFFGSAISSASLVFSIASELFPLFLFGIFMPYMFIRELIFLVIKKIKN